MMLINPFSVSPSGMPKMLELLFNGADDSTITDSTGRHTPSLSASGTRHIVGNKLVVDGTGFIRADAQSTTSTDFDFVGYAFSIECTITSTSGSSNYIWFHIANDTDFGMCLRFLSDTQLSLRNASNVQVLSYTSGVSLTNVATKVKLERVGSVINLYVNDVVVDTSADTNLNSSLHFGGNGFVIGGRASATGLTGSIDDFIVRKS